MPTRLPIDRLALDAKPFYAYVGAGDVALETLRARVASRREQLKTVDLKTLPEQLKAVDFKTLPTTLQEQVAQLQGQVAQLPLLASAPPAQAKELQALVEKAYNDFAVRGEKVVAELRGGKAKSSKTQKPAAAAKPATAQNKAAQKTATKKAPAKPAAAKAATTSTTTATETPTSTPVTPATSTPATETAVPTQTPTS